MSRRLLHGTIISGLMLVGSPAWGDELPAARAPDLEAPLRIQADGAVIDHGKAWGHSSPCLEDLDGDHLPDLIVGDFSGKFTWYRNTGKKDSPTFHAMGLIQAGDKPAEVRIYCCIGCQARFGDLDGDGIRDMISNSYDPGDCYLFRGLPEYRFAARADMKDKAGVPVRSSPVQQQDYQSFGSFYELVDWDADGDLDLLIGCFEGLLKVRLNEGTTKEPIWAAENINVNSGDKPLKVEAHFCPKVADWDQDGRWDIIAGSDDGSVTWFRNTGEPKSPAFAEGVTLVPAPKATGYERIQWSDVETIPGIRSQPEVADFNGDGKPDLLVGDFQSVYDFRPDLTEEQRTEVKAILEKHTATGKAVGAAMKALREDFAKRFPGDAINSEAAGTQWQEEYTKLRSGPVFKAYEEAGKTSSEQLIPYLRSQYRPGNDSFNLPLPHGYVWLYLRK